MIYTQCFYKTVNFLQEKKKNSTLRDPIRKIKHFVKNLRWEGVSITLRSTTVRLTKDQTPDTTINTKNNVPKQDSLLRLDLGHSLFFTRVFGSPVNLHSTGVFIFG